MAAVSQPPTSPPSQSLARRRGRRPALIPHNEDLSISLSAASAALGMASYSPNREGQRSEGVLWAVLGSAPPPPPPPQWDSQGHTRESGDIAKWGQDAMDVDYDDGDDERVERELVRSLISNDVFTWVNSTDGESDQAYSVASSCGKNMCAASGSETAPTSPLSGNFPEQLEFRRRRLEEAAREDAGRK
ncbi:unnamed protein product [Tuber aestivum]|uniref:Uncharacterized protein n=1 Tax=Tuber aestivum TaxID=59557 RepID=A0A292PK14_9PEZI|nr:unnamed protein product [Tuber aestivum]